jgi:hypothetical protein
MAGGIQLRSTVSEAVSTPHSDVIGQSPPQPHQAPIDWAAYEAEQARLAQAAPPAAETPSSYPGVTLKENVSPVDVPVAPTRHVQQEWAPAPPTTLSDDLQIPCSSGAFLLRFPPTMTAADVDLVTTMIKAFLRNKRAALGKASK